MRKVRRKSGLNTFDKELIRIVGQHLHSIGLKTSAEVLMAEAGTQLIHPNASNFKKLVLNGEWSQAVRSKCLFFYNFLCKVYIHAPMESKLGQSMISESKFNNPQDFFQTWLNATPKNLIQI